MNERRIHQIFEIGILFKGLHGLVECIGGTLLALISTRSITHLVALATQDELSEDPRDFVASHLMHWATGFSAGTKTFYAAYLLSHGLIKVALVAALLRGMLWAYPASLIALALFMTYQLYSLVVTGSPTMWILTVFDLLVMWLIWHEYKLRRNAQPGSHFAFGKALK
ncbi:DUF2127 domain-containing protein [Acidisoma sp. 7E03]